MKTGCKCCNSCGMPLEKKEDHALSDINKPYCTYCTKSNGNVKSYKEVHQGMTEYLIKSEGLDPKAASKAAEEALSNQPEWKSKKNC